MSYVRYKNARRDKNEKELVKAARKMGAGWVYVSEKDAGDGLLGYAGRNVMVEVKNPEARGSVSEGQERFHDGWPGARPVVIETIDDLIALMKRMRTEGDHDRRREHDRPGETILVEGRHSATPRRNTRLR